MNASHHHDLRHLGINKRHSDPLHLHHSKNKEIQMKTRMNASYHHELRHLGINKRHSDPLHLHHSKNKKMHVKTRMGVFHRHNNNKNKDKVHPKTFSNCSYHRHLMQTSWLSNRPLY